MNALDTGDRGGDSGGALSRRWGPGGGGRVTVIVRPAPKVFEFAEACPGEVHAAAGYEVPVFIAEDSASGGVDDFFVGGAAEGVGGCLSEDLFWGAVIYDCPSFTARTGEPFEDGLAFGVYAAPFWALLAF